MRKEDFNGGRSEGGECVDVGGCAGREGFCGGGGRLVSFRRVLWSIFGFFVSFYELVFFLIGLREGERLVFWLFVCGYV